MLSEKMLLLLEETNQSNDGIWKRIYSWRLFVTSFSFSAGIGFLVGVIGKALANLDRIDTIKEYASLGVLGLIGAAFTAFGFNRLLDVRKLSKIENDIKTIMESSQ